MEDFSHKYGKYTFAILAILIVIGGIYIASPFFPALLWAGVLTVLMYPLHARLKTRMKPALSAATTVFSTIAIVGIPVVLVGLLLGLQLTSYTRDFSEKNKPAEGWNTHSILVEVDKQARPLLEGMGFTDFTLSKWVEENQAELTQDVKTASVGIAKSAVITGFTLVVAFLTMFFLLKDGHLLLKPALDLIPLPPDKSIELLERMKRTIFAVFVGVVLVALVQGALAGIAYMLLGVPTPIVWMVATIVLCVVPLLGAPVVYVPLSLMLIASGHQWQGMVLLAWGFGVVSQIDNVLKPLIIGSRVNLHPMAIFFSLLGGVLALGPVGLMAGPVLLTLLLGIAEIVRERLQPPQDVQEPLAVEAD